MSSGQSLTDLLATVTDTQIDEYEFWKDQGDERAQTVSAFGTLHELTAIGEAVLEVASLRRRSENSVATLVKTLARDDSNDFRQCMWDVIGELDPELYESDCESAQEMWEMITEGSDSLNEST